jgi:restriction system protein
MSEDMSKVRTPWFPRYSVVNQLLTILQGVRKSTVSDMLGAIVDQTGTPQNPVDWSNPDSWIAERLTGDNAALAKRIWEESKHTVNPRYIAGAYLFINNYSLLNVYQLSARGKAFLENDAKILRELDTAEGLLQLLSILATKTRARRGDLLPEWGQFLSEHSKYKTANTVKDTLRRRLVNLIERNIVLREGTTYTISPKGVQYLTSTPKMTVDAKREVLQAVQTFNSKERERLRKRLSTMPPHRFEQLVRDLLEAMGYEDVVVTKESGDKGVDVVATVQFGITTITEVVQVKRHQTNITRPILDQLRGALPYHKAIRGTLITVGNFSTGCTEAALYPGAAPIGLINGDKLLDLLLEHEIGIQKRIVNLYEVDEDYFEAVDEQKQLEGALISDEDA